MTYDKKRNIDKLNEHAERGDAVALYELGCMYLIGDGVSADGERAIELITLAAEKGLVEAQCKLGEIFECGYYFGDSDGDTDEWIDRDAFQSFGWFLKAADAGDRFARLKVGDFYFDGIGVNVDRKAAAIWYELAANQGSEEAVSSLLKIHEEKYAYWLERESEKKSGNIVADYLLGVRVDEGFGISGSWVLSITSYEKAAHAGHCMAQIKLASMLLDEKKRGYKPAEAFKWLSLAAKDDSNGSKIAILALKGLEVTMTVDQLREGRLLLAQHIQNSHKSPQ